MIRLRSLFGALVMGVLATAAQAASVTIVSMQYSAAQPVPHLHYDGPTEMGDVERLQAIYETFVKCGLECVGPNGGPTAVLTLNGPGGSYGTGLALADFLRANHIATVVERDAYCYSACAFAFLGGAAYSPQQTIGTYIDRVVEPGGILGFHAPYKDEAAFLADMELRGVMEAQGGTRDNLSIMVRELVKWNVDPEVIFFMVGKGPDESYDILGADDYYLARTALPPSSSADWTTSIEESVRNACIRLIAYNDRVDPLAVRDVITSSFGPTGVDERGKTLSGYALSDTLFDANHCSIVDETIPGGDYEISLYMHRLIGNDEGPMLSFNNRNQGWSNVGGGGNPVKRLIQKGSMNHMFLPIGIVVDSLDRPGEFAMMDNRFYTAFPAPLALGVTDAEIDNATRDTRVSHYGDVWIFEHSGNRRLFDTALAGYPAGMVIDYDNRSDSAFVREGKLGESGVTFSTLGLSNGTQASIVTILVLKPDGSAPTQADLDALRRVQCAATLGDLRLNC